MVKPSANFRTQQFKLGTEEILYVNMSFHKLQRKTLIALGNLGYVLRVESSPWEQRHSCIIQLHMRASSINISTSNDQSIWWLDIHYPFGQEGGCQREYTRAINLKIKTHVFHWKDLTLSVEFPTTSSQNWNIPNLLGINNSQRSVGCPAKIQVFDEIYWEA